MKNRVKLVEIPLEGMKVDDLMKLLEAIRYREGDPRIYTTTRGRACVYVNSWTS